MNAADIQTALFDALFSFEDEEGQTPADYIGVKRCQTFEEEGLMTEDKGLMIKMFDGSLFKITIQKA